MASASFYDPVFGRAFSRLALTPSSVSGCAALVVSCAYLSVAAQSEYGGMLVAMEVIGATLLGLLFTRGGPLAWIAAFFSVGYGGLLFLSSAVLGVWLGGGGALVAIAAARHFVDRDRALDNFDRLLAVCAGAMCWAALGAWGAAWLSAEEFVQAPPRVPVSVLAAVLVGMFFSGVVIVGDVRRLRWLKRLRSGQFAGYVMSGGVPDGEEEPPALIGGWLPKSSVLVLRQALSTSAFRGAWRETAVARTPSNLAWLTWAVWIRLIAVSLVALVSLSLAVDAVWAEVIDSGVGAAERSQAPAD